MMTSSDDETSSDDDVASRRCHIPAPRTGFAQPTAETSKQRKQVKNKQTSINSIDFAAL